MPATQFNKEWVEKAGLVKFDFLGLKTLSVIHRCLRLIAATEDRSIDLERLPLDDQPTFQMLSRGETLGVFQLESSGMTNLARNLRVADFEEIIAVISLFRPGPMDKIPEYIARRHGRQKWDCYDPRLEPAIATTYGIIIYQEQVMQVSMIMAGYSMNQADNLRRAMGKKDAKGMNSERAGFMAGAVARGYSEELSRMIFDQMDAFASYAFNKSHAAAYAITAYHTAWLKCHYPVEFFAASMSYDLSNTDKLNQFRAGARADGLWAFAAGYQPLQGSFFGRAAERWHQGGSLRPIRNQEYWRAGDEGGRRGVREEGRIQLHL